MDPAPYFMAAVGAFIDAAALVWLIQAIPACESVAHPTALGTFVGTGVVLAAEAKPYAFPYWPLTPGSTWSALPSWGSSGSRGSRRSRSGRRARSTTTGGRFTP
jgi:hypothetical protein